MPPAPKDSLSNTMTDTATMNEIEKTAPTAAAPATSAAPSERPRSEYRGRSGGRPGGRGGDRGRGRAPRERSEFDQVNIQVRRVARVMAGGRRFNFSVTVVIGDRKGRVGVGLGKAADTALAIDKAVRDAKKHMITVKRTDTGSIPHAVDAKYASSTITVIPSAGRGLVAGSAMRTVLELAGVTDVIAKIHTRTKNKLTIARATVAALATIRAR